MENEGEAERPAGNCEGAVAALVLLEDNDAANDEREGATAAGLSRPPLPPPIADMPILDMRDDEEDSDDDEAAPFMPVLESAAAAAAPRCAASANVAGRYGNEASR